MGCSPFLVESNCNELIIPPLVFTYSLLRRLVQPFQQISGPGQPGKGYGSGHNRFYVRFGQRSQFLLCRSACGYGQKSAVRKCQTTFFYAPGSRPGVRRHPVSGRIVFHIGGYAPVSVPRRRKSSGPASASRIPSVPASWPWFRSLGYRKSLPRSESFPAVPDGSGCLPSSAWIEASISSGRLLQAGKFPSSSFLSVEMFF